MSGSPPVPKDEVSLSERAREWMLGAYQFAREHYAIDTRALAAFRITLGAMLLYDLYSRALHMTAHYTDEGFMPRDRLLGGWSNPLFYSFHNWGGNITSQTMLFVLATICALMLLAGYKTRLVSVSSYILLTSLQGRNYLILQGGDDIMRVMLFWSCFTPLGTRYSVDAVLKGRDEPVAPRVFSIGALALACQLLTMYFVSALLKSGPAWHANGNAIWLALHHHAFATPFGIYLRQLPESTLRLQTHAVWLMELVGPFLFFIPWKTHLFRTLQVFLFIGFHLGLFLTMNLGHFPWVCMLCWLAMLPSWFWDVPLARVLGALRLTNPLRRAAGAAEALVLRLKPHLGPRSGRPPLPQSVRKWSTAFVALLVIYVGQGTAYAAIHGGNVEGAIYEPLMMIRMNANWGMFAPNPPSESGWFVFVGKQKTGAEIDPWRDGAPVSFDQPELPTTTYKQERWRKFLDNIMNPRHAVVRPYFLRWVCNDWNQAHPTDQITRLEFFHMVQTVRWPDKGYFPLRKEHLGTQHCPPVRAP